MKKFEREFFKFEEENPEVLIEDVEGAAELIEINKSLSEKLKKEGFPVDDRCRIIPREKRKYNPIEKTKFGHLFEIIKTVILNKFLEDQFVIVRTSEYDDSKNKVDNIIFERKTGQIVCAFDETFRSSEDFKRKREIVLNKNLEGGVNLDDGLIYNEKKEIEVQRVSNLPIFCLILKESIIRDYLSEIKKNKLDLNKKSDYEKTIFQTLILILDLQAGEILSNKEVDQNLKRKIKNFQEKISHYLNK